MTDQIINRCHHLALFVACSAMFVLAMQPTALADAGAEEPAISAEEVVADERDEDPDRQSLGDEETRQLAEAMNNAFEAEDDGRYEDAQRDFLRSYAIYPHSNLLLSIARVSASLGENQTAVDGYRRFLERRTDYEERAEIEERIALLEEEIDEESRLADGPALSDLSMPSLIGWSGVAAALVGTTSLIAGGLTASSINRDFEALQQAEADGDRDQYILLADGIESKQTRGQIFTYGGLGLVVAGAAVVVLDYLYFDAPALFSFSDSDAEAGLSLDPFADGGGAVHWRWSF